MWGVWASIRPCTPQVLTDFLKVHGGPMIGDPYTLNPKNPSLREVLGSPLFPTPAFFGFLSSKVVSGLYVPGN